MMLPSQDGPHFEFKGKEDLYRISKIQLYALETGHIGGFVLTYKLKSGEEVQHRRILNSIADMQESCIVLQEGEEIIGFINGGTPICHITIITDKGRYLEAGITVKENETKSDVSNKKGRIIKAFEFASKDNYFTEIKPKFITTQPSVQIKKELTLINPEDEIDKIPPIIFKSELIKPKISTFGKEFDHLETMEIHKYFKEGKPLKIIRVDVHYIPGKDIKGITITYQNMKQCTHVADEVGKVETQSLVVKEGDYINGVTVSVGDNLLTYIWLETKDKGELKVNSGGSNCKKIVDPKSKNEPEVLGFYGKTCKSGVLTLGAYFCLHKQSDADLFN